MNSETNISSRLQKGKMDGEMNFLAIISRITNPRLAEVIEEFDETISFLFDPVEEKTEEQP